MSDRRRCFALAHRTLLCTSSQDAALILTEACSASMSRVESDWPLFPSSMSVLFAVFDFDCRQVTPVNIAHQPDACSLMLETRNLE